MIHLFKRRPLQSSERVLKNNRRFAQRAFAGIFVLLAVFFLSAWGSRREGVSISDIKIIGTASVSEKEVLAFADDALRGSYWGLFSRKNSLIYPKDALERGLFENFPHIANVAISRKSLRELSVEVNEREPSYLWCGEEYAPLDG